MVTFDFGDFSLAANTNQTNEQRMWQPVLMFALWKQNQNLNTSPSSPPSVHSDPRKDPFPFAPVIYAWITAWVLPWKPIRGPPIFLLPLKHDSGDQISHSSHWPSVKSAYFLMRENSILGLQCEISDLFLLVWSAVLLIHRLYCWHNRKMVCFHILEEVRGDQRSDSSSYFFNFIC